MLLASPYPHDEISINRVGASIPLWPMYLPSRRGVLTDVSVDRGIGVHQQVVIRVEGGLGRLALVDQNPSHELGALSACMCS